MIDVGVWLKKKKINNTTRPHYHRYYDAAAGSLPLCVVISTSAGYQPYTLVVMTSMQSPDSSMASSSNDALMSAVPAITGTGGASGTALAVAGTDTGAIVRYT